MSNGRKEGGVEQGLRGGGPASEEQFRAGGVDHARKDLFRETESRAAVREGGEEHCETRGASDE